MLIAYLTSEYPSLSHTFIVREIAALRRRGLDIETFSIRRPAAIEQHSETDREEHARTEYLQPLGWRRLLKSHARALFTRPWGYCRLLRRANSLRTPGWRGRKKWLAYFAQAIVLAEQCRRRQVGHIHNHFANASANVAMLAAAFLGIPWSFTLHGLVELDWEGVGRLSDKLSAAAFAVAVCDFNCAQAMRLSPTVQWEKLHVVRCGLDLAEFPYPRPQPAADRPLRILSVARLSAEKGILGLLQAFRQVRRAGIDAELFLVGDGPQRGEIEAAIHDLHLHECCFLVGPRFGREVIDEYRQADIVVLSSFMEGLPVVLMEALALGVPVVAPMVAGIPELVVHERTGLLFAPSRWDQLAAALIRLARQPALRAALSERGRAAVEARHDIEAAVVPLLTLLNGGIPAPMIPEDVPAELVEEPATATPALPDRGKVAC